MAQTVKHLPTMRETWVQSLGQEDVLEKDMATHSSILAWKIRWTEEPGRLQSMGSQRVGHDSDFTHSLTHSLHWYLSKKISHVLKIRIIHVHFLKTSQGSNIRKEIHPPLSPSRVHSPKNLLTI